MTLKDFLEISKKIMHNVLIDMEEYKGEFDIDIHIDSATLWEVFDEPISITDFIGELEHFLNFETPNEFVYNLMEFEKTLTIKEFLIGLFSMYYRQKIVTVPRGIDKEESKIVQLLEYDGTMYALGENGSVWERTCNSWVQILDEDAYFFDD